MHILAVLIVALFALVACSAPAVTSRNTLQGSRPNVVVIISDDQRYHTMEFMPRTRGRIFEEGVEFTSGYVTTSRCCPSRSSILTGMYAHNHGVLENKDPLYETTLVQRMQEAGYYTGVVGKYLNSYPRNEGDPPLPEFDYWVSFISSLSNYYDPMLVIGDEWGKQPGYMTYILRDHALAFLDDAAQQDKPFLLLFAPYAPHKPALAGPGDEKMYLDVPPYRPPNFNEEDVSDKPLWLQETRPPLTPEEIAEIDRDFHSHIQSLNALDIAVEDIVKSLEEKGILDDTLLIYLSDNGGFFGEHRIDGGKIYVYEPSVRVPFALRYPPLVPEPYQETHLVANIDIAPTIYELAGIPIPEDVDGLSLLPLLQGGDNWREDLLLEGWPKRNEPPFLAIHTGRYVYTETEGDRAELYDLENDPYQLENQIDNPEYAQILARLKVRLAEERASVQPTPTPSD